MLGARKNKKPERISYLYPEPNLMIDISITGSLCFAKSDPLRRIQKERKTMKTFKCKLASSCLCLFIASKVAAQIFNPSIVGYYTLGISSGDNLIANEFNGSPDNTLDSVLIDGVASGSTFSQWDSVANQLLPASIFDGSVWSINYSFGPDGGGGVLHSPSNTTIIFLGTVVNVDLNTDTYAFVPPARASGTYLLAMAAPFSSGTFQQIVGRAPDAGDSVRTLDAVTQVYSTNTFNGSTWNNGDPSLALGSAAYFDLAPIPEPSIFALLGLCTAIPVIFRRRNSRA
jgi:hypothetical protein